MSGKYADLVRFILISLTESIFSRASGSCNRNFKCSQYTALTDRMTSEQTRLALFWHNKRPKFAVGYRRFGTTYPSNLQWSSSLRRQLNLLRYRGRYKQWLVPLPLSFLQFPLLLWRSPSSYAFSVSPCVLVATSRSSNLVGSLTRLKDESRPTPSPISQRIYLFQASVLKCSTYEDRIDRLSRNVSNQLSTYAT
jgi:hypothetical protein